jgi:hypothetical protein
MFNNHIGWGSLKKVNGDDTFKNLIYSTLITVSGAMAARALTSPINANTSINSVLGYESILVGSFVCVISGIVWYIARVLTLIYMPEDISNYDNAIDFVRRLREYIKENIENEECTIDDVDISSVALSARWNESNYKRKGVRFVICLIDCAAVALYFVAVLLFVRGIYPFLSQIALSLWQ